MKQNKTLLPVLAIITLTVVGYRGVKSFSQSKEDYTDMVSQNIEALAQTENNPSYMYGYEMTDCYGTKKLGDREVYGLIGARCQPTNPAGICTRGHQWGDCF